MQIKLFVEKKVRKFYGLFLRNTSEPLMVLLMEFKREAVANCDSSVASSLYITASPGGDLTPGVILYPTAMLKQWSPAPWHKHVRSYPLSYPVFKMKFMWLVNSVVKGKATGPAYQTGQSLRGHHGSTYRACTMKLHHLVAVIVSLSQNAAIVKHLRIIRSLVIWHLKMYDMERDPLKDSQWVHQFWLWC